jgi:hypothetical protein
LKAIRIVILTSALTLLSHDAWAHPETALSIDLAYRIKANRLECAMTLSAPTVLYLVQEGSSGDIGMTVTLADPRRASKFLKETIQVMIDGVEVISDFDRHYFTVRGEEADAVDSGEPFAEIFIYNYPLKSDPRTIGIACLKRGLMARMDELSAELKDRLGQQDGGNPHGGDFGGGSDNGELQPSTISGLMFSGAKTQGFQLTRDEPGFTWHAPGKVKRPAAATIDPGTRTTSTKPKLLFAMSGLAGIAFLLVAAFGKRRAIAKALLLGLFLTVALASGGYGIAQLKGPSLPPADEAIAIFNSLHRNIYRSFDYKSESDIYDSLANSLHGPILDSIYNDVYRSLILQDQGGAVCTIDKVNVLRSTFIKPSSQENKLHFQVQCDWQVLGMVTHWGHAHKRTNEYSAVYTVTAEGEAWKITDSKVLKQQRVEN